MKYFFSFCSMSILIFLSNTSIQAQEAIYLNSRTIQTAPDFNPQKVISVSDDEIFNNQFYRLVQFNRLPMPADKADMALMGIKIMDYIPSQAFVMSFPKNFNFNFLEKYNVKTLVILRGEDKMSDALRQGNFPNFAQKVAGRYDLFVMPYANVSLSQMAIEFQKQGFEVVGLPNDFLQTVTVRVTKDDIGRIAALPYIRFIDFIDAPPQREDTKSSQLQRGNMLNTEGSTGLKYDGQGFAISYGDDGPVGPHIDFQGRLIQVQNFSSVNGDVDHSDQTAGVAGAAGNLDPDLRGAASGATIISQIIDNYPQIQNAEANQSIYRAYITSTSFGQGIPGQASCNRYNEFANQVDVQAFTNRRLFHVFSAGNSGTGTCINVANFGNITGGYKLGKNIVTVGNLDINDKIAASSSRGPSLDGRIKPDLCALGTGVYTTLPNNQTISADGTSFACPAVAAGATQLYHAFSDMNPGQIPEAALIKAAMLNSADDLGNVGPDFTYGWGRVNLWRAYTILKDKKYIKNSIAPTDSTMKIPITVPAGVKQVKIMLYWHDPAGAPNAAKALVNDLDLSVKKVGTGQFFLPYVLSSSLNSDSLQLSATRGYDHVNNVEQVIIDSASLARLGTTDLEMWIKPYSLPNGDQSFYLVYEFDKNDLTVTYPNGGESIVAGRTENIRWEAFGTGGSFGVDFSNDGGVNWTPVAINVAGNLRALPWSVPDDATSKACIRIRQILDNTIITDLSDNLFTVSRLPTNFSIKYVCQDSSYLAFDTVRGAKAYEISRLGAKYMEAVKTTALNFVSVPIKWTDSAWFAVRPIMPDGSLGHRTQALSKPRIPSVCPTGNDLQTQRMTQFLDGTFYACNNGFDRPLSIWIKNFSLADVDSFRVGYQISSTSTTESIIKQKIRPSDSILYTVPQKVHFPSVGAYNFKIWAKLNSDINPSNDSLSTTVYIRDRFSTPLSENFDNKTFPPDGFQTTLSAGKVSWSKATNIIGSNGNPTTTAFFDGQTYTTQGTKDTLLTWLCDLTGIKNPQLSFDISYQLYSAAHSPSLAVVVSTNCGRNFVPTTYSKTRFDLALGNATGAIWQPIAANQWRRDTVSLAAYKDSIVLIGLVFTPDNDNRLYIDNINIEKGLTTAIETPPLSIPMLSAYPNPSAEGIFTLALKNFETQSLVVKIFDTTGKQVIEKKIGQVMGNFQEKINLQQQPSGVYLMQVQTENKTYQLKLVKSR